MVQVKSNSSHAPAFASFFLCVSAIGSLAADALVDTFYAVGLAASLCQLFSVLELYHIADGLEKARLLPRFIQVRAAARILASAALTPCLKQKKNLQVAKRSCVLVLVLVLEEIRTKPVVSLLFILWNLVELLR